MHAFYTIIQKEWAEFRSAFFSRLNLYGGYLSVIVFMVICCVYVPFQQAEAWKDSPTLPFLLTVVVPFCVVGTMAPSAFVQERQRQTLEPLLASPASDASIFLGKALVPALIGWFSTLNCALATLILLNRNILHSGLILYPLPYAFTLIGFSLLISCLISVIGAAASLRAYTYIQAQGRLTAIVFGPMSTAAILLGPLLPISWKTAFHQIIYAIGYPTYIWIFAILLIVVILGIIAYGLHSFHRTDLLSPDA